MSSNPYPLPPLQALVAFAVAARHLSFKKASEELDVTPSAISQHVKALESQMEVALFIRRNRQVELTTAGKELRQVIDKGLNHLSTSIDNIRSAAKQRPITISATTAMSSLWLTPRLTQFWKSHSDVAVNQHVSDTMSDESSEFDLCIWYGQVTSQVTFQASNSQLLFSDRLLPVCSPEFATNLTDRSLPALATETLIYLDSSAGWTTWRNWFSSLGFDKPLADGPHVNNYSIAVQAARDGVGLVLGWESLLKPIIDRGLLVTLDEHAIDAPGHFYISSALGRPMRQDAKLLRDWLIGSISDPENHPGSD